MKGASNLASSPRQLAASPDVSSELVKPVPKLTEPEILDTTTFSVSPSRSRYGRSSGSSSSSSSSDSPASQLIVQLEQRQGAGHAERLDQAGHGLEAEDEVKKKSF